MGKTHRQLAILSLLEETTISTREELGKSLTSRGSDVTQAPLSMDLKRLGVVKRAVDGGLYGYSPGPSSSAVSVKSCKRGNPVVVKTETALAAAVAYKIDSMAHDSLLGTVAGEDTLLMSLNGKAKSEAVSKILPMTFEKHPQMEW